MYPKAHTIGQSTAAAASALSSALSALNVPTDSFIQQPTISLFHTNASPPPPRHPTAPDIALSSIRIHCHSTHRCPPAARRQLVEPDTRRKREFLHDGPTTSVMHARCGSGVAYFSFSVVCRLVAQCCNRRHFGGGEQRTPRQGRSHASLLATTALVSHSAIGMWLFVGVPQRAALYHGGRVFTSLYGWHHHNAPLSPPSRVVSPCESC